MKKILTGAVVLAVASVGLTVNAEAAPRTYSNCTQLNRVYPHGVGKTGARDRTSGRPVTNFTRNNSVYNANQGRDRDGDRIACEKR